MFTLIPLTLRSFLISATCCSPSWFQWNQVLNFVFLKKVSWLEDVLSIIFWRKHEACEFRNFWVRSVIWCQSVHLKWRVFLYRSNYTISNEECFYIGQTMPSVCTKQVSQLVLLIPGKWELIASSINNLFLNVICL